ncbi:MAG: hypothetical protein JKY94_17740 [Rhodobacteraceae bacterium]|nr:hypothetical protein [Paracoccaceae bacterium]
MTTVGIDFETYSEAGFYYDEVTRKWKGISPNVKGLQAVGGWAYSEHPSTEIICLRYDIGNGVQGWRPGDPPPLDLFDYLARGGIATAFNSFFEYAIWTNVAFVKYGWPRISLASLRCTAARARAFSLPDGLDNVTKVLGTAAKDMVGNKIMLQISMPRSPTKDDPRLRFNAVEDADKYNRTYEYCGDDVLAEGGVAAVCPPLPAAELEIWQYDQIINVRGVQIDTKALADCIEVARLAFAQYTEELSTLTYGEVTSVSQSQRLQAFLGRAGVNMPDMQAETVEVALEHEPQGTLAHRVLEIRALIGSASIKKLAAIKNRLGRDGRLRDLFVYAGATRTSRWAGRGPQPQNLPNKSPKITKCHSCGIPYWVKLPYCPACCSTAQAATQWGPEAITLALKHIATRDLGFIEKYWGNAVLLVIGVIRSLFVAKPGHRLIGADFSAIEAVVLAWLAGEEWRMEVFRTHGKIYEMSASLITGTPFDEMIAYKEETGVDHPLRKTVGKVAELASGYRGGIGAWKQFGADKFMNDEEIENSVAKWRAASPSIVDLWDGAEEAAKSAINQPGFLFNYKKIGYFVQTHPMVGDVLHCVLPSGRHLHYFWPTIEMSLMPWEDRDGNPVYRPNICFYGWDSKFKRWDQIRTHGGKLTENFTQAVARDIQADAIVNAEKAGYPVVLHVHDEAVAEVPIGSGHSVDGLCEVMSRRPWWGQDLPLRAAGWEGLFYRKG